jgi:hypothetical protein
MPSDAAPEKAGSAEHGDGATVRCYHDSNRQLSFSLLVVKEPIWAIEQPINLARHDEVVLMQSFDLLGAQRDSRTTPAESKLIRWTTLALRKRSAEIGIHHHVAGAYLLRYSQERSWRGDNRRLSNGEQVNRLAALSLKRGKSVDFGGYWQRHSKDVHA